MALGAVGVAGSAQPARAAAAAVAARADEVFEYKVKLADVPAAPREAIEKFASKESDQVTEVYRIRRGNKTIYRAVIEGKQRIRLVRVDAAGKVLNAQEALDRGRSQVAWDGLPKPVQTALNEARGGWENRGDIQRITQTTRKGVKWYCAEITDKDGLRVVWADETGKIHDVDPAEELDLADEKEKASLKYDDLPNPVQKTMDKLRNHKELAHIDKVVRKGKPTHYVATIAEKGDNDRRIVVNADGKVVSDTKGDDDDKKPDKSK